MSRFYVRPESVRDGRIYVEKEESHHIMHVMRLQAGDAVTVFDGTGKEYSGRIASTENKKVIIDVSRTKAPDIKRPVTILLAQAIPKKDKMDLIVQKATELGVDEILPIESSRTVVRPKGDKKRHKIERWEKKAIEAAKQCGRTTLPKIKQIAGFDDIMAGVSGYDLAIMPCLSEKAAGLKSALQSAGRPKSIIAIIGPEGGFTENEVTRAAKNGVCLVSLGRLTLRSDTAAIAVLSILNHEYAT